MAFVNGRTYRFINKFFSDYALNVYGTNAASTGRNVCLYGDDPTDIMQDWVVKTNGTGYRLHSAVNESFVLDRSDGSLANSYLNNAHLCATTQTSTADSRVEFEKVSDNVYRIYLPAHDLYLTATNINVNANGLPASSISNATALKGGTGGESNVYWATRSSSTKQQWRVEPEVDGGTDPEPGLGNFVWPTESRQITNKQSSIHDGVDIGPLVDKVPGDKIYAFMDGVVSAVVNPTSNPYEGYSVRIHHVNPINNGYENIRSQYMHMQSMPLVSVGQSVKAGKLLGYMGNTGNVSPIPTPDDPGAGTHLHFEVRGGTENDFPLGGTSTFYTGTVLQAMDYLDLCE